MIVLRLDVPQLLQALLNHSTPYDTFLPFLDGSSNGDDPIPLLASSLLASLISAALTRSSKLSSESEKALPKVYSYISTLIRNSDSGLQDIGVQEYSALLRNNRSREAFWQLRSETITPLIEILRSAAGVEKNGEDGSTLWSGASTVRSAAEIGIGGGVGLQLLYHVLLVLWQLSFEGSLVGEGLER